MKKIIAIVAIIATITACLCISTNATEGVKLYDGDILVFKDTISKINNLNISISFKSNDIMYNSMNINSNFTSSGKQWYSLYYDNKRVYSYDTTDQTLSENVWLNSKNKTITIVGNQNITDEAFINWLNDNTVTGIPERPLEKTIENTKLTFATTLTVATAIIAWLMANQIALVGLYLYILITLVLIGKRYIKGA